MDFDHQHAALKRAAEVRRISAIHAKALADLLEDEPGMWIELLVLDIEVDSQRRLAEFRRRFDMERRRFITRRN